MASINQFRQLYVVNEVDGSKATYLLDKSVNEKNFESKKNSLFVADASTESGYAQLNNSAEFVKGTKYFVLDTVSGDDPALPNEVGEIKVNFTKGIGKKGAMYFSYAGLDGKPQKSDFIEVDKIVSATAVAPAYLNKDKLLESATFKINTAYFNKKTVNGVNLNINIKNMGGQYKTSGIFPITVFIKNPNIEGPDTNTITASDVAGYIDDARAKDLGGNELFEVSTNNDYVTITAIPSGKYVRGKARKFYPVFTVGMSFGEEGFLSEGPVYIYNADTDNNGDVAAFLEDEYLVERTNSGTIPYGVFPRTTESEGMVNSSANYSCIDIHYYKSNEADFSQKSHGTITLLVKQGLGAAAFTNVNALITAIRNKIGSENNIALADTKVEGTSDTKVNI